MAYTNHNYTNPGWGNDAPPPVNASNLNDISNALEALNITQQEAENIGGTINQSLGAMLGSMNSTINNKLLPINGYTYWYQDSGYVQTGVSSNDIQNVQISPSTNTTIQYGTSFKNNNGVAELNNPTTIQYNTSVQIPAGNYVKINGSSSQHVFNYVYLESAQHMGVQNNYIQIAGRFTYVYVAHIGRTITFSTNASEYPDKAWKNGYYYTKIGSFPFLTKMFPMLITYSGNYMATQTNPNRLQFTYGVPKVLMWLSSYTSNVYPVSGSLWSNIVSGNSGIFDTRSFWICPDALPTNGVFQNIFGTFYARVNGSYFEFYDPTRTKNNYVMGGINNVLAIY